MKMPWQVSATAFYHIFCRYYTLFAIFRLHELRHTFATTALLNGVDVKTVSSMLGHYSAGFTLDTYTHVTAQMQQASADKMGGFLENALPGEDAPEPEPPRGKIIPFEQVS